MTKPVIVTRAGKGSALTWTEGDANVTNLQNATVTIKADTSGTDVVSDLNGSIILVAGNNIALTGDNTAKTITIDSATPNINLNDLSDVTTSGATDGQVLTYNGTMMSWGASSPAGGGATELGDLTDVSFSGPPSQGDLLTFNNTSGKWEPAQLGSIDTLSDVALVSPATGDVLYYSGTAWVDQSFSALVGNIAINASTVELTADNSTNATNYITFVNAATGAEDIRTDTGFTYNPSTGVLTSTSFSGAHNGTVGATTPSTGSFTNLTVSGTVTAGGSAGTSGQVLQSTGSGVQWATASSGGASFALATAQSSLYTSGTNKNITWSENYDSANCLSINGTTGEFTLTAGSYILSLEGMGRIGSQGNGLEFYNVTGAAQIRDMGYSLAWNGGTTFMIPIGSFYLTPGSSNTYVFRFTGNPSSTSITSTVLNLIVRKVA